MSGVRKREDRGGEGKGAWVDRDEERQVPTAQVPVERTTAFPGKS